LFSGALSPLQLLVRFFELVDLTLAREALPGWPNYGVDAITQVRGNGLKFDLGHVALTLLGRPGAPRGECVARRPPVASSHSPGRADDYPLLVGYERATDWLQAGFQSRVRSRDGPHLHRVGEPNCSRGASPEQPLMCVSEARANCANQV